MSLELTTTSPADNRVVAQQLLTEISKIDQDKAAVLALVGILGTGKTTLVQALAQELGVTRPVNSPTFLIRKNYQTTDERWPVLIHYDWYRLNSGRELQTLNWERDLFKPEYLICVEWADKFENLIPQTAHWLTLKIINEASRKIIVAV